MSVSLRGFTTADAAAVHRWFNEPRATEGLVEQREQFELADAKRWVERASTASAEAVKWAVLVDREPEPVGFTALYGLGRQTAPELGILIGVPELWGRGIGSAAQRLTIDRAFEELGAHRLTQLILAEHRRARAVVERLGFRLEGVLREHVRREGRTLDVAVYGLLRADWDRRPGDDSATEQAVHRRERER